MIPYITVYILNSIISHNRSHPLVNYTRTILLICIINNYIILFIVVRDKNYILKLNKAVEDN